MKSKGLWNFLFRAVQWLCAAQNLGRERGTAACFPAQGAISIQLTPGASGILRRVRIGSEPKGRNENATTRQFRHLFGALCGDVHGDRCPGRAPVSTNQHVL